MSNWFEVTKYGKTFTVEQRGRMICSGGRQDIVARDGFQNKTQVLGLIKKYKELL